MYHLTKNFQKFLVKKSILTKNKRKNKNRASEWDTFFEKFLVTWIWWLAPFWKKNRGYMLIGMY